jgi:hypothetical protein
VTGRVIDLDADEDEDAVVKSWRRWQKLFNCPRLLREPPLLISMRCTWRPMPASRPRFGSFTVRWLFPSSEFPRTLN